MSEVPSARILLRRPPPRSPPRRRRSPSPTPDERARWFARALGARQLLEAVVVWRVPSAGVVRAGAAVDAVHAATTVGLLAAPRRRRLALLNCASACGLALAGLAVARTVPRFLAGAARPSLRYGSSSPL